MGLENDTRQKEGALLHTTKELFLALMGIENDTCVMERRGEERRGLRMLGIENDTQQEKVAYTSVTTQLRYRKRYPVERGKTTPQRNAIR